MNNTALLLCLLPLVAWGTGDYFAAKAGRVFNAYSVNLAFSAYSLLIPLVVCSFKGFPSFEPVLFLKFLAASALLSIGFILMVKGFTKGSIGIVAPLANAYSVITLVGFVLFFNENIQASQVGAVIAIAIGVALISLHTDKLKRQAIMVSVKYGIAGMVSFGLGFIIIGRINAQNTWYGNQLIMALCAVMLGGALVGILSIKKPIFEPKALKNRDVIIGGIIGSTGVLGLFLALSLDVSTVVVTAIASASPLITTILAYIFDHERLHLQQRLGTLLVVLSVVYLNIVG